MIKRFREAEELMKELTPEQIKLVMQHAESKRMNKPQPPNSKPTENSREDIPGGVNVVHKSR